MTRLRQFCQFLLQPLRRNMLFFCFMYLLGSLCIVAELWHGSRFLGLLELFLDLYIVVVFLSWLPRVLRRICQYVIAFVAYLLAFIDMTCYVKVHTPLTSMLYTLFLQSDPQEMNEAISTYVTIDLLASPVLLILLILLLHLLCVVVPRLRWRLLRWTSCITRTRALICGCFVGLLLLAAVVTSWNNKHYLYHRLLLQQSELEAQADCDLNPTTYAYIPIYRLAFAISEHRHYDQVITHLEASLNDIHVDSCSYDTPVIVLLIGESFNRHHASLDGYDKPTTPHQQQWVEEGALIPFTDAISSWNVTCESFQHMFSLFAYGQPGAWFEQPLFTQLFKKAGYDVTFLSNQYVLDRSQSFSEFGEDLFMNHEPLSRSQFTRRNRCLHPFDEGLLEDYDSLFHSMDSLPPHRLVIFHFKAMHFEFAARFPDDWTYFKSDDYPRPDLTDEQRQILADYDNAIRYNDDVIARIIQRFEHQDAIVIHMPDHGELVFDEGLTEFGRTLGWTPREIAAQFDIPLWFYATEKFRQSHPEQWERIAQAKDKPYMTDALAHTLLRLAGIHCAAYCPQLDLMDSSYDASRQRLIRGERDYDAIIRP